MISTFSPIRIWYAVGPVVVHSAARFDRLQDERVDDLVEPVGEPHRETGRDHIPAAALDLVRIDVDHQREQRDRVPLEQVRVTNLPQGLQREVRPRGQ